MEVVRIPVWRDRSRLQEDLKELCTQATKLGASDARILNARDIADARLTGARKRHVVSGEEKSIHWPEPFYPIDKLDEAIACYKWAIIFRVDIGEKRGREAKRVARGSARWLAHEKVFRITSMVESRCFYRGYHLAMGLAATDCRDVFCDKERRCWAMIRGRACIHPFKARPSLEVCGFDPRVLAKRAGWVKSSGSRTKSLREQDFLAGLVLVI